MEIVIFLARDFENPSSVWLGVVRMWNSSWLVRSLEVDSALIEVRAIREDQNARRCRGERPENNCYQLALRRWHKAVADLSRFWTLGNPPQTRSLRQSQQLNRKL